MAARTKIEQLPAPVDLFFVVGDDFTNTLTWAVDGEPLDISAYTFTAFADPNTGANVALNCSIIDGPEGVMTITIPAAISATLTGGIYDWFLRWVDGAGKRLTPLAGHLRATVHD